MSFARFLSDETGAVSVDWVVLSGAIVGLGLATTVVVGGGVDDAADNLNVSMAAARDAGSSAFGAIGLMSMDFADGATGWTGGALVALAGFGDVLQIGPNGRAETSVAIPAGASQATVSFNLIGADDLSGVPATIYINNTPVAVYRDNHGNITRVDNGVAGVTIAVDQLHENEPLGSGSHGHDSMATYTITVDDPGAQLTLGIENGSGQPISEEFYAIDDVVISAQ